MIQRQIPQPEILQIIQLADILGAGHILTSQPTLILTDQRIQLRVQIRIHRRTLLRRPILLNHTMNRGTRQPNHPGDRPHRLTNTMPTNNLLSGQQLLIMRPPRARRLITTKTLGNSQLSLLATIRPTTWDTLGHFRDTIPAGHSVLFATRGGGNQEMTTEGFFTPSGGRRSGEGLVIGCALGLIAQHLERLGGSFETLRPSRIHIGVARWASLR